MKISTKGRYALRIMLDLSIYDTGEYIPLKTIAERQEISGKYLEQIIHNLSKAGLVTSARGSQGGYRIAVQPEACSVGTIIRCLEGSLGPVSCVEDDGHCERADKCVTIEVWQQIKKAVDDVVDNITLQQLVDRYRQKAGNDYNDSCSEQS